jgi:hypothetical protein
MRAPFAVVAVCAAVLGGLSTHFASAGTGHGQIMLVNQTSQMIDLYVDDHYGCRALAGLTCSTMEPAGAHVLTAKAADGQAASETIDLAEGGTYTYTITED